MTELEIAILIMVGLFIFILSLNFKLIGHNQAVVIERLGRFLKLIDKPGVYFTIPLIDRVYQSVKLDEMLKSIEHKDEDQTIHITYLAKIVDVKLFVYGEFDTYLTIEKWMIENYHQYTNPYDAFVSDATEFAIERGVEIRDIKIHN